MSIRLEIHTDGSIVAVCDTVRDAAEFAKQFRNTNSASSNGAQPTVRAALPCDQPSVTTAISGLRDRQKQLLRTIVQHDGVISDTALRERLDLVPAALGGLLAGVSKALTAAGVHPKVIDRRASALDGTVEYYIDRSLIQQVREGLVN